MGFGWEGKKKVIKENSGGLYRTDTKAGTSVKYLLVAPLPQTAWGGTELQHKFLGQVPLPWE